ncbi:C-5 sterol desaturase [Phenylobacterium sp. Root77]|uniref:sterol desaturase family protein n=1 Tax=unclassified Phenylobacterium TaxID=2640670 RepID=UPI0006FFA564|nr:MULTISPECIES: sterol desaturase family protein [unclassified Phenylobacterium]KQW71912.1 C-5 sterol desaturase [Phenylobacterium sp. Root1277]KQW94833.1 C-5 sterol desaturase [Phenylobacterium sp. Root1290]KRC44527.1 C-5 sterol desaturase [Phenylobacterium sp. Root77]
MTFDPVTLATPFFILAIILEVVLARMNRTRTNYEARDTAASLVMGLGSTIAGLLVGGLVAAATLLVYQHRLFDIPMTAIWAWVAIFLLEDLTYYWFHRLSHERRFWWAAHVNHHSSQHYNLSTALRQTWTGGVAGTWALWLPLAFLGFPPAMIAIQKGVSLVYQFWIHTEAIGRMPRWFEAVFNTPSHHRVHHARNPRYLDRNYAGILIVWDKLFGTFQPELEEEPCRYGIVKNLGDFNILRVAFHEWAAMAKDVARHPRHAAGYVFGPPGWSHDGSRDTSHKLKAQWEAEQQMDEVASKVA